MVGYLQICQNFTLLKTSNSASKFLVIFLNFHCTQKKTQHLLPKNYLNQYETGGYPLDWYFCSFPSNINIRAFLQTSCFGILHWLHVITLQIHQNKAIHSTFFQAFLSFRAVSKFSIRKTASCKDKSSQWMEKQEVYLVYNVAGWTAGCWFTFIFWYLCIIIFSTFILWFIYKSIIIEVQSTKT
jgi:hypothetical protein